MKISLHEFGDLCGIVVGQFRECSQDIHHLLASRAEENTQKLQRGSGRRLSDLERSQLLQSYRRRLSICSDLCDLSRLAVFLVSLISARMQVLRQSEETK